jgi:Leucine-rich repeat (LRR) protein
MALKTKLILIFIGCSCIAAAVSYVVFKFHSLTQTQSYFDNLDEALENPEQVRVLIIRNQLMESLPSDIGKLVNLRVLNLANNSLTTLPASIGQLKNLEELSCENNHIMTLPSSIGKLKRLKAINLCSNLLFEIPRELMLIDSLRKLQLCNNQIEKVDFSGFDHLEELDLSENTIEELPPSVGALHSLKKLDIYNNKLINLPGALFALNLDELILSGNPLSDESRHQYQNLLKLRDREPRIDSL